MTEATAACEPGPIDRLITIPISHFCEKARWALERAGLPYEERAHLQGIHRIAVRRAGGGLTAPVLVHGDEVLDDSSDILEMASAEGPPELRLYPEDAAEAAEVRALEDDFDERLGPEARRYMYFQLGESRDLALAYGTKGVPAWERRSFPVTYRPITAVVNRVLEVDAETAAESEAAVDATFEEVGERLADGRPYLCGDRFSAADLTFAALSAAVLVPPEYGVPLPQPEELPEPMASKARALRETPAGAHALRMYREERRPAVAA